MINPLRLLSLSESLTSTNLRQLFRKPTSLSVFEDDSSVVVEVEDDVSAVVDEEDVEVEDDSVVLVPSEVSVELFVELFEELFFDNPSNKKFKLPFNMS